MRKIKIRWRDKQGKTFYSRLEVSCGSFRFWTTPAYHGEIDEESIAQLVGYDCDGNEVYDNDTLIDENDVEIDDFVEVLGKYDLGDKFSGYKLKG